MLWRFGFIAIQHGQDVGSDHVFDRLWYGTKRSEILVGRDQDSSSPLIMTDGTVDNYWVGATSKISTPRAPADHQCMIQSTLCMNR